MAKLQDYESSDLPERTKAALRLADTLSGDRRAMDPAVGAALRAELIKKADARKAAKAEKEKSGGDMK